VLSNDLLPGLLLSDVHGKAPPMVLAGRNMTTFAEGVRF